MIIACTFVCTSCNDTLTLLHCQSLYKSETQSGLHYIGSTHDDLNKKVSKHFGQVYKMVQAEFGEEGFCKDASEKGKKLGEFRTSALHFAKHCKHAKTKEEVTEWCNENIKVEKWSMVCKTCLGTSIDTSTSTNTKDNNSVMAFKSPVKFKA